MMVVLRVSECEVVCVFWKSSCYLAPCWRRDFASMLFFCTQGVPACRVQPSMSQGIGGGGVCEEQWIGPSPLAAVGSCAGSPRPTSLRPEAVESLARGESLILLPGVASEAQCLERLAAATAAADRERATTSAPLARRLADKMVRLSSAAAGPATAASAAVSMPELDLEDGPPAELLAGAPAELIDAVLLCVLARIDAELPQLAPRLFAGTPSVHKMREMHERGGLEFSPREPAINVYGRGGEFAPHQDHQALTVLVPLSPPSAFEGGGTGFWPHGDDERMARRAPPALVLRPPAGTALLFAGSVTHAGVPVRAGERAVLVASFSRRGGRVTADVSVARAPPNG